MKLPLFLFLNAMLIGLMHAQTVDAEIAAVAADYETAVKTLDASRAAATARIQENYLRDLATSEQKATANGRASEVAAILKTRERLNEGKATPTPEPEAPAALRRRHAEYFAALAAADREFAPQYDRASAHCLRRLATIEARLTSASPLREQITRVKANLRSGAADPSWLVGTWTLKKGTWKGSRRLNADRTFLDERGNVVGKWTSTAKELRLVYEGGATERLQLPPRNGELKGVDKDGSPLFATKESE